MTPMRGFPSWDKEVGQKANKGILSSVCALTSPGELLEKNSTHQAPHPHGLKQLIRLGADTGYFQAENQCPTRKALHIFKISLTKIVCERIKENKLNFFA